MNLSDDQLAQLFKPLNAKRVSTLKGMSYLEAWDVIAHLTRIFGVAGWDKEVEFNLIYEEEVHWKTEGGAEKSGWNVAYAAKCRLTLKDENGLGTVKEDAATGSAIHQPSRADAHDLALKSAVSDALKRAAKDLGNQFGLSLYDKGSLRSVVGSSLAHHGFQTRHDAVEAVQTVFPDAQLEPPAADPVKDFLETHPKK
jgi:recombination DNA repair RAD52 pathway protein